jgi:N-acetylglucosaminyldiphosphoundecaprenol N-acetyl-beta-D-mannosaminyltransferase
MSEGSTEYILDYEVTVEPAEKCVSQVLNWIESRNHQKYLACLNPHSLCLAEVDPLAKSALKNADLLVPDGIGIVLASRILNGNISGRVTGSDIFSGVNRRLNDLGGGRIFFLGSTEETLQKIKEKMAEIYPRIKSIETYSPPFKEEFSDSDNQNMIDAVNAFKPHVLWVGLTAPKQEKWIYRHKERVDFNFAGAVGAVFDFFVGNIQRSHPFFLKTGLEWLPRLLREPRRLWRRNFISAPQFFLKVFLQRYRSYK